MGTQAGGWGHNKGEVIFDALSSHENGRVWVTKHYASKQDAAFAPRQTGEGPEAWFQEWRVLRFNDETRQSVARVTVSRDAEGQISVLQQPDCLAFLYMKTLAATVAAHIGLAPQDSSLAAALPRLPGSSKRCRVLCVGLGGGSLPLFLAHHFPGMCIDVVEIDPIVIAAAREAMAFAETSDRIRVHEGDAIPWLAERVAQDAPPFDVAFIDAFDGENFIPDEFVELGEAFLPSLAKALHPEHGLALLNAHRGELPPLWKQLALKITNQPWLDPIVTPMAEAYKSALLPTGEGLAYMLGVGKQYNTIIVVARGRYMLASEDVSSDLSAAADAVGRSAGFRFQAARRAVMDLTHVPA